MKTNHVIYLLFTGIGSSMAFIYPTTEFTETLESAIKNKKINCSFQSTSNTSHYGKCLTLVLQNNTPSKIDIAIPAGMQVNPKDSNYQNLVVTENMFVGINPNENKTIPVYAMCTESHDMAPGNETISYKLVKPATGNLNEVANFIAKEKLHNSEGQNAVWCISNKKPLTEISGYDTTAVRKLQTLVAKITHQKMPAPPAKTDYKRNYYAPVSTMQIKVGGSYSFAFSHEKNVHIGMFNTQNVLVRELYKNEHEPAGRNTIKYAFDASVYTDSLYFMRMYVNGEKKLESKMVMN